MTSPKNINRMIDYQAGAVVSREIISQPTGTVTLFAFDKKQGLSEHTAPYDALIVITDGAAQVTVVGARNEVKTGEMLLLPAKAPHSIKAVQPFKMMLIMIKSQAKPTRT